MVRIYTTDKKKNREILIFVKLNKWQYATLVTKKWSTIKLHKNQVTAYKPGDYVYYELPTT